MFVTKENSLNDSDSQSEYICRQSMARAGFAFGDAPVTFHWTQLINPLGDKKAAITAYEILLVAEPDNKSALEGLAFIYQTLGNRDQALNYRKSLRALDAKNMGIDIVQHPEAVDFLLAKTGEAPQPDRVPLSFIGAHFDVYAANFDAQLCEALEYKGHLLVEEVCLQIYQMLKEEQYSGKTSDNNILGNDSHILNVLDIGCGTGLTGQAIKGLFDNVDAVDLSDKMLEIARKRNVYRTLSKANYHDYLVTHAQRYHVVTASDVLNYVGCLDSTFRDVYTALKTNGYFVFTVEKTVEKKTDDNHKTKNYRLRNTGRYQHSADYIQALTTSHGFSIMMFREVVLRVNDGQNVDAYLFSIQKK